MYFATEIQPILEAMEAKRPRTARERYEDYYGSAITFDANNRAHAPYDGFIDPVFGNTYRGGEYLPTPPDENGYKRSYDRVRGATFYVNGECIYIQGTKAQRAAGAEEAKVQTMVHDRSKNFVGEVGKRSTFTLKVIAIFEEETAYGTWVRGEYQAAMSYTHELRDDHGNRVVYKGSKKLTEQADGQEVTIISSVKSHYLTKDGRKITYIQRPKFR